MLEAGNFQKVKTIDVVTFFLCQNVLVFVSIRVQCFRVKQICLNILQHKEEFRELFYLSSH